MTLVGQESSVSDTCVHARRHNRSGLLGDSCKAFASDRGAFITQLKGHVVPGEFRLAHAIVHFNAIVHFICREDAKVRDGTGPFPPSWYNVAMGQDAEELEQG